ncbi:hypothetical protein GCM10027068_15430 [Prescottella soli]
MKRGKNGRQRSGADCPICTVFAIRQAPLRNEAQQTRLSSAPTVPNVIVRAFMSKPFVSGQHTCRLWVSPQILTAHKLLAGNLVHLPTGNIARSVVSCIFGSRLRHGRCRKGLRCGVAREG